MNRSVVVVALVFAVFMSAVEATVVATAMPSVVADLGGVALYGWIAASYLLASTVTVPVFGKLADSYGRKPILLFGIGFFLIGSLACGLATSAPLLILWRLVQGLGAGAIQPMAITIVGDLFTLEERARTQAVFGAVWAIAGAVGPLLGGFLVQALSWRWVFWFNVPFGLLSALLLVMHFREHREQRADAHVDWLGALLLTTASIAVLLASEGTAEIPLLVAACVLAVAFVAVERRARDPLLPLALITQRHVAVAACCSMLLGALMTSILTYIPFYAQAVLAYAPSRAGSVVTPMLLGWPIAAALASRRIRRWGFRRPVQLGSILAAAAAILFASTTISPSIAWMMWPASFLLGCGMGLNITVLVIALQTSVGWEQRGVVTALSMFARTMGGALGVGALGALLTSRLSARLDLERVAALLDPHARETMPVDAQVLAALTQSFRPVFWTVAALAVVNIAVAAWYPASHAPSTAPAAA